MGVANSKRVYSGESTYNTEKGVSTTEVKAPIDVEAPVEEAPPVEEASVDEALVEEAPVEDVEAQVEDADTIKLNNMKMWGPVLKAFCEIPSVKTVIQNQSMVTYDQVQAYVSGKEDEPLTEYFIDDIDKIYLLDPEFKKTLDELAKGSEEQPVRKMIEGPEDSLTKFIPSILEGPNRILENVKRAVEHKEMAAIVKAVLASKQFTDYKAKETQSGGGEDEDTDLEDEDTDLEDEDTEEDTDLEDTDLEDTDLEDTDSEDTIPDMGGSGGVPPFVGDTDKMIEFIEKNKDLLALYKNNTAAGIGQIVPKLFETIKTYKKEPDLTGVAVAEVAHTGVAQAKVAPAKVAAAPAGEAPNASGSAKSFIGSLGKQVGEQALAQVGEKAPPQAQLALQLLGPTVAERLPGLKPVLNPLISGRASSLGQASPLGAQGSAKSFAGTFAQQMAQQALAQAAQGAQGAQGSSGSLGKQLAQQALLQAGETALQRAQGAPGAQGSSGSLGKQLAEQALAQAGKTALQRAPPNVQLAVGVLGPTVAEKFPALKPVLNQGGGGLKKKKRHTRKKPQCINISINVGDKNVISASEESSSSEDSSSSEESSSSSDSSSSEESSSSDDEKEDKKRKQKYTVNKVKKVKKE